MSTIPAGDGEGEGFPNKTTAGQPEPEEAPANDPVASEKRVEAEGKKTTRQRVFIGSLLLIIVAIAIIGTLIAVLPESKEKSAKSTSASANTSADVSADVSTSVIANVSANASENGSANDIAKEAEPPIKEDSFQVKTEPPTTQSLLTKQSLFPVEQLPLFSANITEPYASTAEAKHDIEQLAKSIVNQIIWDEATASNYGHLYASTSVMELDSAMAEDATFMEAPTSGAKAESGSASAFEGADDFETYQHEAGVVKNDLVKSNGVHVFAADNEHILVWDVEGNRFETITMPNINLPDQSKNEPYKYHWSPKPRIKALLMNPQGTKLTVVVDGYGLEHQATSSKNGMTLPIVNNYLGTRVIVYGIEGSTLTELAQTDINGYYVDSYMVGNNVHIVTKMRLNTWEYLSNPLQRWEFQDMTDDEYIAAAIRKAEEIIPAFVDEVTNIVTTEEDTILLSRLAVFADSISDSSDTNIDDLFGGSALTTITQVNSFDTDTIGSEGEGEGDMPLDISKSMVLVPGHTGYVYATDEWIWVTDQGWAWNLEEGKYAEQTMLLGFRLDGASSTFDAVGSVPGSLLNQFAIDFVKDNDNSKEYIRIATTQNFFQSGWWGPRPMPMPIMNVGVVAEESSMTVDNVDSANPEAEEDEGDGSRTMNQIIIFEVPKAEDNNKNNNALIRLGSVKLGKKDERITAVRFFDDISYVVTFEQTDPFYVMDLSDPTDPKVLGELEIPGFSQFMHPIKEDNSMLITVGQDADENGTILGFQISIFNSTIPTDPKLIDRLVIENDKDSWSGSSASWDERAFRYIQVGDLGRLIIPIYVYSSWDNSGNQVGEDFEGFMVFGVDLTKAEDLITREFEIDHSKNDGATMVGGITECYCGHTWLPERSMVFDGNLMTMKNQEVISTDLVTHETQWNLIIKDDDKCCNP